MDNNLVTLQTDLAIIRQSVIGVWDRLGDGSRPLDEQMRDECIEQLSHALAVVMKRLG